MKHDWKNIERNNNPNITIEATNTCCALKKKKKETGKEKLLAAEKIEKKKRREGGKKNIEFTPRCNNVKTATERRKPPSSSFDRNRSGAAVVDESCSSRELVVGEGTGQRG